MSQPLVSVIMPVFNGERYLGQALQSVLEQSYERWELIVIDDGSSDNTAEIVNRFVQVDHRIRYQFQLNGGQGKARNAGIKLSRGELIAFLDADDLWLREKLQKQVRKLGETQSDIVFSDGFIFYSDATEDESRRFDIPVGRFSAEDMAKRNFLEHPIPLLSALGRRESLKRAGFFDEDRRYQTCEDLDLWISMAETGSTFYGMKEPLVRYRRHGMSSSLMSTDKSEHERESSQLLQAKVEVLKKHQHRIALPEMIKKRRLTNQYRALILNLLAEGRVEEAKAAMKELAEIDQFGISTILHRILIRVLPRQYSRVSVWIVRAGGFLKGTVVTAKIAPRYLFNLKIKTP